MLEMKPRFLPVPAPHRATGKREVTESLKGKALAHFKAATPRTFRKAHLRTLGRGTVLAPVSTITKTNPAAGSTAARAVLLRRERAIL